MKWISTKDQLPKIGQQILFVHNGIVDFGLYDGNFESGLTACDWCLSEVPYWQPLPEPPEVIK